MKTKRFQKKLTLNKKTIVDLNNGEMKGVQGGHAGMSKLIFPCNDTDACTRVSFCSCGETWVTGYPDCYLC